MHYKTAKEGAISIEEAVRHIANNVSKIYQWYPVLTKKGILIEMSGTSEDLRAHIPKFWDDGTIIVLENGYIDSAYSIDQDQIEFPTKRFFIPHMSKEDFIKFINNTDFRKWIPQFEPVYEMREVLVGYTFLGPKIKS